MKRFIKVIPLVIPMLVGCSDSNDVIRYDNVYYCFNEQTLKYDVKYEEKKWELELKDFHHVYLYQYPQATDGYHLAINSFYIKGKSYQLFVYSIIKQ